MVLPIKGSRLLCLPTATISINGVSLKLTRPTADGLPELKRYLHIGFDARASSVALQPGFRAALPSGVAAPAFPASCWA